MTCYITYATNRYLDEMGANDRLGEDYSESDDYAENLAEYLQDNPGATEKDYWESGRYERDIARYARRLEDY